MADAGNSDYALVMRRLLPVALFLSTTLASGTVPAPREYRLRMFNTHSLERVDVVYRRGEAYDSQALAKLDLFLRDRWVGTVKHYDPRLFDLLNELTARVKRPDAEINVICGYRTAESNAGLRKAGRKVAKASLHMLAEAIDIRLPGVSTSRLRDTALAMGRGGVGYYPGSDFVHVDTGRVRRW
jgi:uncharacterized protein YcbK (DUF882 family)